MNRLVEQMWPKLINEGLSEVLWHVTSLHNAKQILKTDGTMSGVDADAAFNEIQDVTGLSIAALTHRYNRFVSFARSPTTQYVDFLEEELNKHLMSCASSR